MIFSVLTKHPENDAAVESAIKREFPSDHYVMGRGQWLVSTTGTTKELYSILFPDNAESLPTIGGLLITSISGYFGRSPADMWEWMAAKSEKKSG